MYGKLLLFLVILISSASCANRRIKNPDCMSEPKQWLGLPIPLTLHANLKNKQQTLDAINYWNAISTMDEFFVVVEERNDIPQTITKKHDGVNFITDVPNWNDSKPNTIALTSQWIYGSIIFEADIYINSSAFDASTNAMFHELGHVLGVEHNEEEPESVFYPLSYPGQRITDRDIENLKCLGYYIKP